MVRRTSSKALLSAARAWSTNGSRLAPRPSAFRAASAFARALSPDQAGAGGIAHRPRYDMQMELANHVPERAPTLILSAFACALSVQRQRGPSANRA
jgi:hypothetical protein